MVLFVSVYKSEQIEIFSLEVELGDTKIFTNNEF